MKVKSLVTGAAALLLSACTNMQTAEGPAANGSAPGPDASSFSPARMKADVTFISHDLLRGRETGSEGHRIAANYVAAEFARLGLKPMGDGGYFQEVPFKTAVLNRDQSMLQLSVGDATNELKLGDDFYMRGNVNAKPGTVSGGLVFAGYGIHAPELGHDDLAGLDLQGKVVVFFGGAPKSFQTEIRAHHGSAKTKAKELMKRGAVGVISFNTKSAEKRFPFKRFAAFIDRKSYDWVRKANSPASGFSAAAAVSHDIARQMFEGAAKSFDDVLDQAENGKTDVFPLQASVTMQRGSNVSDQFDSPNVLAAIEGSDPKLKDEYIILSAHLDHIGVSENAKGDDKINNGAMDNATGISVMLEVARTYMRYGIKPRRSILLAAVTGEERGLLGAEYFAHYPTVRKDQMVANVNLDMPVLVKDFTHLVAFGANRSSLGPITERAVAQIGVGMADDPLPDEGLFTRSDHYRFVQQGVPAVFLATDFGDNGKTFIEFLSHKYHTPEDEVDLPIDFEAGAKFAYVNWLILNAIADGDERPSWNEGDFFGETFGRK